MIVAERIKQLRLERGWTQTELARRVGYADKSAISYIESGKNDLTQFRIAQFAEAFGVAPRVLMGWDVQPEDAGATAAMVLKNPGLFKLAQDYLSLNAADRLILEQMAASLAAKQKKD
jgi:transcriptional regulator with XRE-family HTH domain